MSAPIRVLIVDDSPVVRTRLQRELSKAGGIQVVAAASDPFEARDMITKHAPQVIILDMEMPRMDGLTFLRKIMKHRPTPTIIVSSLTPKGCDLAVTCLQAGAIDVLPKPGGDWTIDKLSAALVHDIRVAATARMQVAEQAGPSAGPLSHSTEVDANTRKVIAIGASTGGTEALNQILSPLPKNLPGILVVQHMPALFTASFAERLNSQSALEVKEAEDGDEVRPGRVLVAPGDFHMKLTGRPGAYHVAVNGGPKVCRHRPSVEVLFQTTSQVAGGHAMGIILTGMGDDGATALGAMRERGALTIAQDEATCVVFGMPCAAVERGNVDEVLPLGSVPQRIVDFAGERLKRRAG
jgi:two-component system, chemotaxis family, protein-glutamate methylesterase/glutaminase